MIYSTKRNEAFTFIRLLQTSCKNGVMKLGCGSILLIPLKFINGCSDIFYRREHGRSLQNQRIGVRSMRRELKTGEKILVHGREATVLCCNGDQVLIHTSMKSVLWIYLEQIDLFPKAAV